MNTFEIIVSILLIINFICIVSVILIEKKRPQATVSWVLVMIFLPIIGVLLYIILGNTVIPTLSRRAKRHFKNYDYYRDTFYKYLELNKEEISENLSEDILPYRNHILFNANNNDSIFSDDNEIKLYTDAKEKYADLFKDIENAEKSVNIEYFIIRNDSIGKELVSLLSKKAEEGVKINLLYDELGSLRTTMATFLPIELKGGRVCRFFGTVFSNLIRCNNRNHRKVAVIDGKIAYIGGMNIGNEYIGLSKKLSPWRDTHLRIEGSSVYSLQVRFLIDFISSYNKVFKKITDDEYRLYFPEVDFTGNTGVQIISSGPDSRKEEIKKAYLKIINTAKNNIYIQTPYFVPDEALSECLKLAAESGVDVRIMIPKKPDKLYIYYITLSHIEELIKAGAKIYLYDGFLHSKTVVADSGITTIGTANFDVRSFTLNYEVNAVVYDREFAEINEDVFKKDMEKCTLINPQEFEKRGSMTKLLEKIFRLFSPLA